MSNLEVKSADCDMRPATVDDVPAIIATLETGRALLAADGIDQWQHGTGPSVADVTNDLMQGWGRVFCVKNQVAATAALIPGPDANYDVIEDGRWDKTGNPSGVYATIHRVAVSPAYRGNHIARRFYLRLIEEARVRGFAEVRVDTHEDNVRMRHVIEGCGFAYAGRIYIDGDRTQPRRAYQLFL
ncbi:GNAT family N-acetyltransferase [Paratractidigestivibacter sp.]|uniref:GNAT family N-acetyltransferase n=1 Tax=Paratractidigestivibacter sp. TaxID=2847316 RepID=UPI002ABD6394|nr:GNAT family N-acetyltransferase [Paratractidigestivibacter sp.]